MEKIHRDYSERGVVLLAMNLRDPAEKIATYFNEGGFSFLPLRQKENEVSKAYGVTGFPTNYVIAPDGKIAGAWVGFKEMEIRRTLEKVATK